MNDGYIYRAVATPPPEDVQDALDHLSFRVNDDMELLAVWIGETDNPFNYYLNANYELIIGV